MTQPRKEVRVPISIYGLKLRRRADAIEILVEFNGEWLPLACYVLDQLDQAVPVLTADDIRTAWKYRNAETPASLALAADADALEMAGGES
jgi:hypothetical protein